jgi:hypothetical protein
VIGNEDKCPSFNEVWEELEHGEGGETFVKARELAEELVKSIEAEHDKRNAH